MTRRAGVPVLAAGVAFVSGLPGLWFPFLSDDWGLLGSLSTGYTPQTIYQDFRPLFMGSLWLDRQLWGLSPGLFHLTNLAFIAVAVFLAASLIRRYSQDVRLTLVSGLLIALHPYHVENAAWIAARTDTLMSVFFLSAILTYERWRERAKGYPIATLLAFELALLSKETAVTLPLVLVALGVCRPSRRITRREWTLGLVPLGVVALVHFLIVRAYFLGGAGRLILGGGPIQWIKNGVGHVLGSLLPVSLDHLVAQPVVYLLVGGGGVVALSVAARFRQRRWPLDAFAALSIGVLLVAPYSIGFEERYLFLPSIPLMFFLARMSLALGGRVAITVVVMVALGWTAAQARSWTHWARAATVSRQLVADLVEGSRQPEVQRVILVNAPFRISGASVGADLGAAVSLSGGRPLPVRAATWVSYRDESSSRLGETLSVTPVGDSDVPVVRMTIPDEITSRLVGPPLPGKLVAESAIATVTLAGDDRSEVSIELRPETGDAVYVWSEGRLHRIL